MMPKTYPKLIQILPFPQGLDDRILALFDDGQLMECYVSGEGRWEWIDFPRPLPKPISESPKHRAPNRLCDRG